jgi:hydroxyacylglutathione hydrolase
MKHLHFNHLLLTAAFLLMTAPVIKAQQTNCPYKATNIVEGVWTILETAGNGNVNIYLVEGRDSALIIDTGFGSGDLLSFVKTLTNLPLIVVNTHGHGDHIGCDLQFVKIYLHPDDFNMLDAAYAREKERELTALKADEKNKGLSDAALDKMIIKEPRLCPVREGYAFNLGGRKLEVFDVPGHTHGSIALLDREHKILFAGDHINEIVWLFLKDCYPLEVYLKSLQKIENMAPDFDIIMPGHNTPLAKTFVAEQIAGVKSILDGTCQSEPYNYSAIAAGALVTRYQSSQIAYDPKNLFMEKK